VKPPGVPPSDTNRFSFRLAGSTGKWNPSRKPPSVIKSGDQVNIYCHSVGVGPYGSISKPPAEASPVKIFDYQGKKLWVPVNRVAFGSPDRELIQQYDRGELPQDDKLAFEKMGLITGLSLAPGPTESVESTQSLGGNVNFSVGKAVGPVTIGPSFQRTTTTSKEYTVIDGKRETIDYKKLQKSKYDKLNLDWGHARKWYLSFAVSGIKGSAAVGSVRDDPFGFSTGPATFTVLFE
jgi:hypothetical protein